MTNTGNYIGAVADHFLKVTMKLYKCLASAAKGYIAPKGFNQPIPSTIFQMLAERTCKRLTAPLYNFMAVMQRVWHKCIWVGFRNWFCFRNKVLTKHAIVKSQ